MPKRSPKKSPGTDWTQSLDPAAIDVALEDATVDAHDEDERHADLLNAIGDELAFPFSGRVLGESVSVVGMEWPENDGFGLDLVIERNGTLHRVEARSVELIEPLPEGHLFLAANLLWKRMV